MSPVHFPGENGFLQMTAETVFYYMAGGPPTKNNQYYTDKVYNGQGYLVSQHYRIDVDNAINITSYDFDLRYEYIE